MNISFTLECFLYLRKRVSGLCCPWNVPEDFRSILRHFLDLYKESELVTEHKQLWTTREWLSLTHFFSKHLLNLEYLPGIMQDATVKKTQALTSVKQWVRYNVADLAPWQRIWEHRARPCTAMGEVRKDFLEKSMLELNLEQLAF